MFGLSGRYLYWIGLSQFCLFNFCETFKLLTVIHSDCDTGMCFCSETEDE